MRARKDEMNSIKSDDESAWGTISQKLKEFIEKSLMTKALFTSGQKDELDIIGNVASINDLYHHTSNDIVSHLSDKLNLENEKDIEFLKGRVLGFVSKTVLSAWKESDGNYDDAVKMIDASLFMIKSIFSEEKIRFESYKFMKMPDDVESSMMVTSAIAPCMGTIMSINAIKNEEIKSAILDGLTPLDLTNNLVYDIIKDTSNNFNNLLNSTNVTIEDLGEKRSSILKRQILNLVKDFYAVAFDAELQSMKEAGLYSNIYQTTKTAIEYFLPVFFKDANSELIDNTEKESLKEMENLVSNEESNKSTDEKVIEKDASITNDNPKNIEHKEDENSEAIPQITEDELAKLPVMEKIKTLRKIKEGLIQKVPSVSNVDEKDNTKPEPKPEPKPESKPESKPVKEASSEPAFYTQEEIDSMPVMQRIKAKQAISKGNAVIITEDGVMGMK